MRERDIIYLSNNPWVKHLTKARSRCNNPKSVSYKNYGAKGIKCLLTIQDMKWLWVRDKAFDLIKPSLDRINSKEDYSYDNCRFIELSENIAQGHLQITHCPSGHEYNESNTYREPKSGYRKCKKCNRIRSKIVYKNKKERLYV